MTSTFTDLGLSVFATCPPWTSGPRGEYLRDLVDAARWSEAAGCTGSLIYTDNAQLDPWIVADEVASHTARLAPLVAVQPVYMHPYSVAKLVASLGALHGRKVYLNLVAGGFKGDLAALGDDTPHDRRYDRLVEYGEVILGLLATGRAVTYDGEFYRTKTLRLEPRLPEGLQPGVFVSGSSAAGIAAARRLGATAVKYPKPAAEEPPKPAGETLDIGLRVGIIAREREDDAWAVAHARFPADRRGQLTRELATKVSDSHWHHDLARSAASANPGTYWLVPFENYKTMCPYLVGSYSQVAAELTRYLDLGHRTFILDVPAGPDELMHTAAAFEAAAPLWEHSSKIS
jgi:alkanesulfonate monooxygenase